MYLEHIVPYIIYLCLCWALPCGLRFTSVLSTQKKYCIRYMSNFDICNIINPFSLCSLTESPRRVPRIVCPPRTWPSYGVPACWLPMLWTSISGEWIRSPRCWSRTTIASLYPKMSVWCARNPTHTYTHRNRLISEKGNIYIIYIYTVIIPTEASHKLFVTKTSHRKGLALFINHTI